MDSENTYLLNLLLRNILDRLGDLTNLVGLATVDQTGSSGLKASLQSLNGL